MGRIERDEADMTLCPTNPTAPKMLVGEQTFPLHPIELLILNGRKTRHDQNMFGILFTFDGSVWAVLVFSLLLMALLMTLLHYTISRISPWIRYQGPSTTYISYVFMLTQNTFNEGTAHPPPKKNSISLLWMSWLLSIPIILMSAFAGQLKASMMFKPEKPKIHNLLDLYNSQHDVYLAKDSAGESALKADPARYVQKMYARILSDKTYGTAERIIQDDVLDMVLNDRASIITSRPAEAMVAERKCSVIEQGDFYISERPVRAFNAVYHLNYRLSLDLRRNIQDRIGWLADSGLLDRWWKEIAGAWNGCSRGDPLDLNALSISDFQMIACFWLLGISIASVLFVVERRTCVSGCAKLCKRNLSCHGE
ncbi:uncharacterized protein LOC111264612 [Varroa jacobsoni]|uniref:uncharacterized protein LOC111264612 n=1 Tax=Varroa jacobsoni TaxID=62625 RepID=UPI000BF46F4D|nr:uncharacterized protein LOC111264612 [Varroa jacobsoni]